METLTIRRAQHEKVTPTSSATCRSRWLCLSCASLVLILGWSARSYSALLPPFLGAYAPDTPWALLVFLLVAAAKPSLPTWRTALIALAFAYGIEFSQLYQAPWINAIRATRLGGLVLGHGFLWSDLVCHSVGIDAGARLEQVVWGVQGRRVSKVRPSKNEN